MPGENTALPIYYDKGPEIQEDCLDRGFLLESFIKIVGSLKKPTVISVQAPWGTGKTHFLNQVISRLNDPSVGIKTVRVDAWSSDFANSPFFAIFAQLSDAFEAVPEAKVVWTEKVKRAGGAILRHIVCEGIKKFTGVDPVAAVEAAAGAVAEVETPVDLVAEFKNLQQSRSSLVIGLTEAVAKLPKGRLVVVVDELDRCRPDYAIELLEDVKHLFSVPGLTFVLAVDPDSLRASAHAVFGVPTNKTEEYLQKFIDVRFHLPAITTKAYAEKMYAGLGLSELEPMTLDDTSLKERVVGYFSLYSGRFGLTARAQKQAFDLVGLCLRTAVSPKQKYYVDAELTCFLCLLSVSLPDVFKAYRQSFDPEVITQLLQKQSHPLCEFIQSDAEAAWVVYAALFVGSGNKDALDSYYAEDSSTGRYVRNSKLAHAVRAANVDIYDNKKQANAARRIADTIWYFGWNPPKVPSR